MLVQVRLLKTKLGFSLFLVVLSFLKDDYHQKKIYVSHIYIYIYIYIYKSSRVLNQKRISLLDKETNLYHYIFKTLLNTSNLNSNPY